jgi:outer membrane lipoprotein-sorting protein
MNVRVSLILAMTLSTILLGCIQQSQDYLQEMLVKIEDVRGYRAEVTIEMAGPDLTTTGVSGWVIEVDRVNKRLHAEMQGQRGQQMFLLDSEIYFKDQGWKKTKLSQEEFEFFWQSYDELSKLEKINVSDFQLVANGENGGYVIYRAENSTERIKEKKGIRIESHGNTSIEIWIDKATKLPAKYVILINATHVFYLEKTGEREVRRMITKTTVDFLKFDEIVVELPEEAKLAEEVEMPGIMKEMIRGAQNL